MAPETLLGLLGLAGLIFGLVNLVRPTEWLGISSRSSAGWLVVGSLAVLVTASTLDPSPDPVPVESAATTTTGWPDASLTPTFPTSTVTTPAGTSGVSPSSSTTTDSSATPPPPTAAFVAPAPGPSGDPEAPSDPAAEVATVIVIKDGDTVDIRREDGSRETIRLIGVNAPERGECWGPEATRVLGALIPLGSEVGMTTDVSDRDQFDRLLRYLWVGSMSVNEELVRRGAVIARRYPPDTALSPRFEAAQTRARDDQAGLWAPDACGGASDADVRIIELRHDAEGDDNENLNDEWIRIRNEGDTPVDLTRWGIKDESATNRFIFPSGYILAPGEIVTVYTGCGDAFETSLYWCSVGSAVWNNDGDTAFLTDPTGNTHFSWTYSR